MDGFCSGIRLRSAYISFPVQHLAVQVCLFDTIRVDDTDRAKPCHCSKDGSGTANTSGPGNEKTGFSDLLLTLLPDNGNLSPVSFCLFLVQPCHGPFAVSYTHLRAHETGRN